MLDFGCCRGFCESQVIEVVNTEALTAEARARYEESGGLQPLARESPEQENASPKMRLRRVIKEFAHRVVGHGLDISFQSPTTGEGQPSQLSGTLRMDKRLSRIEVVESFTPEAGPRTEPPGPRTAIITMLLSDIHSFRKGCSAPGDASDKAASERDAVALTVIQEGGVETELFFDSTWTRDRAYTCFKIFHMSVSQSLDSQSLASSADNTINSPPGSPAPPPSRELLSGASPRAGKNADAPLPRAAG